MKVLLVSPSYDPIVGGTETFVMQLAATLNALGVHTDVMTFNMNRKWKPVWSESSSKTSFTVFRIPAFANPLAFLPINPLYLISRVNVFPKFGFTKILMNYDVIHFCDEDDLSFPFFSCMVKKPKIMHSLTPMSFESIRHNFFQRSIFRRIADLYIPCLFQIDYYVDMGISRSRLVTRKSVGVNSDVFKPDESKRLDSLVLFVGRLQKLKGVHVFLQAIPSLKTPVHAVIIGPFDQNDPVYISELENSVKKINSQGVHKVELLGRKDEKDLVPWYQGATMLVAPHLDQICGGLTTLEALACSTPVVATGDEVVKERVNGLLVPPNDAARLAIAINELLENKELRRKLGSEGRRTIEEQYSWTVIAKDLIQAYEVLVNS